MISPFIRSYVNINTICHMLQDEIGYLVDHEKIVQLSERILQIPDLNTNKLTITLNGRFLIVKHEGFCVPFLQELLFPDTQAGILM
jgi:hypothetical protein